MGLQDPLPSSLTWLQIGGFGSFPDEHLHRAAYDTAPSRMNPREDGARWKLQSFII